MTKIIFTEQPDTTTTGQFELPLIDESNQILILNQLNDRFNVFGTPQEQNAFAEALSIVGIADQPTAQTVVDSINDTQVRELNQHRLDQLHHALYVGIPNNDQLDSGVGIDDENTYIDEIETADVCNLVDELNDQLQ